MSTYHENEMALKADDKNQETDRRETKKEMSRRKFVRNASVGAAAAAAVLAVKGGAGGSQNALAQSGSEDGTVAVDALLITYVSSPDGSVGNSTLTLTDSFTSTFRLTASADLNLSIGTSSDFTVGHFSVGGSTTFNQGVSAQVTDAITVNNTQSIAVSTPAPGQPNHTVFYGLQSPQVNLHGDPTRLLFKFLNAGDLFSARADSLQTPGAWPFSQTTIDGMLAQYPPLTDPTGGTLTHPRFKKRFSLATDAGVSNTVAFSTANGSGFSDQLTVSLGVTINSSSGFNDSGLQTKFSVGQTLNFKLTAVQEIMSNQIMSISFVLNPSAGPRVFKVYRDKVFKTYLVIAGGAPALSGQPLVQGTIYDSFGNPIPNALVTLTQSNVDYAKVADGAGNYYIATESGSAGDRTLSAGLRRHDCKRERNRRHKLRKRIRRRFRGGAEYLHIRRAGLLSNSGSPMDVNTSSRGGEPAPANSTATARYSTVL
jgi:hypothetical protein